MKVYKELLMDHFEHPRHKGHLEHPDFSTMEYNPSCGDSIGMQGKVEEQRLVSIAFVGKGCVISQATASMLCQWALQKSLEEILALNAQQLQEILGMQLGPLRLRCALLSLTVLQEGIRAYKKSKGL